MRAVRGLICLCLLIANSALASAQQAGLRWETNLDAAMKTAASTNKLVLVHFWAPWCRPCQKLETAVFKLPGFGQQLDTQYIAVKLDLDQNHSLAQKWGVTAIPTDVVLTPQGQVVYKTHSPQTAELYVSTMQQIASKSRGPTALLAAKPASAVPSLNVSRPATAIGAGVAANPATTAIPPGLTPPVVAPPVATPQVAPSAPMATRTSATMPINAGSGDGGRYDYYYGRGEPTGVAQAPNTQVPVATAAAIPAPVVQAAVTIPVGVNQAAPATVPVAIQPVAVQPAAAPISPVVAAAPVASPATPAPSDSRYSDNRYSDNRYSDDRYAAAPVAAAPVATGIAPPAVSNAIASQPSVASAPIAAPIDSRYTAQSGFNAPAASVNATAPQVSVAPPQANIAPPQVAAPAGASPQVVVAPRKGITQDQLPPGSPVLALDGFCPTTLAEKKKWVVGNVQFGAIHRGRTYIFSSETEQQKFLSNPDRFSPIMAGNDPVLAMNQNQTVPGRREFGVFYNDRVVLCSSPETLAEFSKNPTRYAAEVTAAMR